MGILFSIPLRRALIVEEQLVFPEGVATAEILKAGDDGQKGAVRYIVEGGVLSAILQFAQSGLQICGDLFTKWVFVGKTVIGFNLSLSGAFVGAGYIVGISVGISLMVGAFFMYGLSIPIAGWLEGVSDATSASDVAGMLRSNLKYIGVGAMISGGIAALISVLKPIRTAIKRSFEVMKEKGQGRGHIPRTDRDMPMQLVLIGVVALIIPIYFLFHYTFKSFGMPLSDGTIVLLVIACVLATVFIGFLVAAISGYMSGLVGNSSNPVSGILIASALLISCVMLVILAQDISTQGEHLLQLAAALIMVTAIIAGIGVLSCDNLQDLKSGYIVGSTPWKQQVGLFIGVIVSAAVIAPILQVLYEAYGMGGVFPRAGMDPTKNLAAPQSVLMATIAKAMFGGELPYKLILIGVGMGILIFIIDMYLKRTGRGRLPALGVALGMYLPMQVSTTIFLGGFIHYMINRRNPEKKLSRNGVLFASGVIAGEALIGIFLAIPFALTQSTDIFRFVPAFLTDWTGLLGLVAFAYLVRRLYIVAQKAH